MKKKINLLNLLLFSFVLFGNAQVTHTVTSNGDSGEGTLRDIIENVASSGDSIVIESSVSEIVLLSEISSTKDLRINGQNVTVKVSDPGVSAYRVLNFLYPVDAIGNVALYNLTLLGGDVSANGNVDIGKGGALFTKRSNIKLINCTISKGKAYSGGGFCNGDGALNLLIDGCVFTENIGTNGNGAAALSFTEGMEIKNSLFENNGSLTLAISAPGVDLTQPANFTNCIFRNNKTNGSRGGAALSVRNASGVVNVVDCLFEGNINNGTDGGPALTRQGNGTVVVTNSTFHNNFGGRGAFYIYAGIAKIINSTFTANKCVNTTANYGGAFYARTDGPTTVTLVNNIFAYNYNATTPSTAKDVFCASGGNTTLDGTNNLIANGQNVASLLGKISFSYDAIPANDTPLFASYTTNSDGQKIPVLDVATGTIPLMVSTSAGIEAGIASYSGVTIPTKDKREIQRNPSKPSIGSYDFLFVDPATSIKKQFSNNILSYWSENGVLTIYTDTKHVVNIYSIEGRFVNSIELNKGENVLHGLSKGIYLVNRHKIIVK